MIGTILVNLDGVTLWIDVGTYMGSLNGSFDGSNDGMLEGLLIGYSLGYTDGKVYGSDEVIKLVFTNVKVLGNILGTVEGIISGLYVETYLGSLDESFGGSNDVKLEVLLIVGSMRSTDGKVLGSYEVVKLVSTDGKVPATILGYLDLITLVVDVGIDMGSLDGSCDGSSDGKLEGLLLGGSLVYTDGNVFVSDEGIKLVLSVGKFLEKYL